MSYSRTRSISNAAILPIKNVEYGEYGDRNNIPIRAV